MAYSDMMVGVRRVFEEGRTRKLEWRVSQLEGLLNMLKENEDVFAEALYEDLKKPRVEALGTEIDFLRNEIIGNLQHRQSSKELVIKVLCGIFPLGFDRDRRGRPC